MCLWSVGEHHSEPPATHVACQFYMLLVVLCWDSYKGKHLKKVNVCLCIALTGMCRDDDICKGFSFLKMTLFVQQFDILK